MTYNEWRYELYWFFKMMIQQGYRPRDQGVIYFNGFTRKQMRKLEKLPMEKFWWREVSR